MKYKNETGRSLVEIYAIFAVAFVLAVVVIVVYYKAVDKRHVNKTFEVITHVVNEVRSTYANKENYLGMGQSLSDGKSDKSSPAERIIEAVAADAPYPVGLSENVNAGFSVTVYPISKSTCVALHGLEWDVFGDDFAGTGVANIKKNKTVDEAKADCQTTIDKYEYAVFYVHFNPAKKDEDKKQK